MLCPCCSKNSRQTGEVVNTDWRVTVIHSDKTTVCVSVCSCLCLFHVCVAEHLCTAVSVCACICNVAHVCVVGV